MRSTARLYSAADLARMADVPHPTFSRHQREGRFGRPTVTVGRRMIYDEVGAEAVLAFYRTWRPWRRGGEEAAPPDPSAGSAG